MGYSRAAKVGILKKVLLPESRSIAEISRESGVNQQTIRNWIKQHESGAFNDVSAAVSDKTAQRLSHRPMLTHRGGLWVTTQTILLETSINITIYLVQKS